MNDSPAQSTSRRNLVFLFGAGLAVRITVALLPLRWLLQKTFPDDSYMYWQVARNILAGNGPSLDGINITTAYHPLWMLPTLGVMTLFDNGGDLPVHISLVLAGLLDMVTGWLVWKSALRLVKNEKIAFWATAAFLFNPYHIGYVLSGLGDGLNALCLMAHFYFYLKIWDEKRDSLGSWVLLGLLAGLSMLARTDSVFFHIAVLTHLVFAWEGSLYDRLRRPFIVGVASCLLVVPWLLYMKDLTGHFMQTSASAHPYVNHARYADKSFLWHVAYSAGKFAQGVFWNMPVSAAWGPVLAALGLVWLGRKNHPGAAGEETALSKWKGVLLLPLYAMVGLALVHGAIRWFIRQWYFMPMAWIVPLWLAVLWEAYGESLSRKARKGLVALFALGVAATVGRVWIFGNYPWQTDMYDLAHQVTEVVGKSDKPIVGGFNILMQSYYNPNLIMNLDGIGNDPVLENIKDGTLGDYIDQVGLKYLIDWDYYLKKRHATHLPADFPDRLIPVVECESWGSKWKWGGPLTLYRLLPRGEKRPEVLPPLIPCKRPE